MTGSVAQRLVVAAAAAGLSLAIGGCTNSTTYGTGRSPGAQTLEDLAGIAALSGPKPAPIDYAARPPIVPPPNGTPLPAPGEGQAALASNWPKDPDIEAKKFKAEVAARTLAAGDGPPLNANDPRFRLPPKPKSDEPAQILVDMNKKPGDEARTTPEQAAAAKKLFAEARTGVKLDENGLPVRQYLTDPPSVYRAPDANAPAEFDAKPEKKKKWKWPWQ